MKPFALSLSKGSRGYKLSLNGGLA